MLNVVFVRHSMTEGNLKKRYIGATDESLCEEGISRIHQKSYPEVEEVYSSPLKRCVETAQLIYPDKSIIIVEDLKECNFGDFENKNYMELSNSTEYQKWVDSGGKNTFPNGENPDLFKKRCVTGFKNIVKWSMDKQQQTIAIIAHGGTIMSIFEQFAFPKKDYFDWNVDNANGYFIQVNKTDYCIKVLRQIP